MLAADGVMPSTESIADGSYPYVNDFYAVIRAKEAEDSPARRVVAWLESDEGQQVVAEAGYVPAG
jgi:phosphate transport system substrate-binding protein